MSGKGVPVPGRVFITAPLATLAEAVGAKAPSDDPGPRLDLAPGEEAAVLAEPGGTLRPMRWQMIMSGRRNARGRPMMQTIVNARAETVFQKYAFTGVRRGVFPVNGWYEWTGSPGRKTRWDIRAPGRPVRAFAVIWDVWLAPGGREIAQMATLTVDPSADVRKIHHRMPAILAPDQIDPWLSGTLQTVSPTPAGLLAVTKSDLV